jgi:hypothetical protein
MHLGLAIAMGGGICCPVGALNRKSLAKLLLDPEPFGCRIRSKRTFDENEITKRD